MTESLKAAFLTLGCKVNQYETDAMRELLEAAGYDIVDLLCDQYDGQKEPSDDSSCQKEESRCGCRSGRMLCAGGGE